MPNYQLNIAKNQPSQKSVNRTNAIWGGIEYSAQAITLILLTPLVLSYLGKTVFGLLVVSNTILGLSGVVSLGIGPATLHFVAKYRETGSSKSIRSLVETSIVTSIVLGIFAGTVVIGFATYLPYLLKTPENTDSELLFQVIRISGLGLPFIFLSNVLDGALRGFEKYDLAVPISALTSLGIAITHISLVLLGFNIIALVSATVIWGLVKTIAGWLVLKLSLIEDLRKIPAFSWSEFKKSFNYGAYVSTTSIVNVLHSSGEMLIVAAMVGPALLTSYAIPTKILNQTHALLSKIFSHLFPYATKLISSGKKQELYELYNRGTKILCSLSTIAIPGIAVCCGPALALWLNEDTAKEIVPVLQILSVRFAVFPLSILTSNLLLAAGKMKVMTIIVGINTLSVLPLTAILAYAYGIEGAAYAQLIVFLPMLFTRYYIEKTLFGIASFSTVALPIFLITTPLVLALIFVRIPVNSNLIFAILIGLAISATMTLACWTVLSAKRFSKRLELSQL